MLELAQEEAPASKRALRRGLILGAILHVVVFLIVFPSYKPEPHGIRSAPKVYIMKQVQFSPPDAAPRRTRPVERPP